MAPGKISTLLLSTGIGLIATPSFAQQSDPQEASVDRARDDEILVVATRREEPLQEVPLAVTALGGKSLTSLQ